MATTIRNKVASINAAAAHFALRGYYVNSMFSTESKRAECTIYFHDLSKKTRLEKALQCFADEGDEIEFRELKNPLTGTLYVIQLSKEFEK